MLGLTWCDHPTTGQIRGDVTISLRCVLYALNKLLHGLSLFHLDIVPRHQISKVGPINRLTIPVGWLKLLQLTVLSRFAIAVISNFLVALFVWSICPSDISVGIRSFVIGLSQISSFCLLDYMACSWMPWTKQNLVRTRSSQGNISRKKIAMTN